MFEAERILQHSFDDLIIQDGVIDIGVVFSGDFPQGDKSIMLLFETRGRGLSNVLLDLMGVELHLHPLTDALLELGRSERIGEVGEVFELLEETLLVDLLFVAGFAERSELFAEMVLKGLFLILHS